MLQVRHEVEQKTMPIRMSREPVKRKAFIRAQDTTRHRTREEAPRNIPDREIRDFVARMREYAEHNSLGRPTLLFAQTSDRFGVCLDWRDDRRAFSINKASWTVADYTNHCDALRNW